VLVVAYLQCNDFYESPAVVLSCLFVDNAGKFYFTATATDTGFRLSSATLLGAGTAAAMYIFASRH
jgi:hypothetical protein